jgi:hypothetical protein
MSDRTEITGPTAAIFGTVDAKRPRGQAVITIVVSAGYPIGGWPMPAPPGLDGRLLALTGDLAGHPAPGKLVADDLGVVPGV